MHTVNPALLSKNMDTVLNDAADMRAKNQQSYILPEHILLVLLRSKDNPGSRILNALKTAYGVDLAELELRAEKAMQTATDKDGKIGFLAKDAQAVPLSRGTMIVLDEALTLSGSWNEIHIDTDHCLTVMAKNEDSIGKLLHDAGITNSRLKLIQQGGCNPDWYLNRPGLTERNPPELYFRDGVLHDMIALLTGQPPRHLILIGRKGIGKTSLIFSLRDLMLRGSVPEIQGSMYSGVDDSRADRRKMFMEGLNRAENGIVFVEDIYRFFACGCIGGFSDVVPLIESTFRQSSPMILATATEEDYLDYLADISVIRDNSQIYYVPEPSIQETVEILKNHTSHLHYSRRFEVSDEVLNITAELAKRYESRMPLPRSALGLLHGAASHTVAKQENNHIPLNLRIESETVKAVQAAAMGIPIDELNYQSQAN